MILLSSADTLQVFLGGATTTTPGVLYAAFADIADDGSTFAPGKASAPTNGATEVTLVASPASGDFRQVKYLSIYNADSVNMIVTVQVTDAGTDRRLIVEALSPGQRLEYVDGSGFSISTSSGGGASSMTIITEASVSTMDPATHAGLEKLVEAGGDVTFDSAETYVAGQVFNISATAALDLVEDGVTLTPPAGGTLALAADMSVSVVMKSGTTGRVIGQTVPA